MLEQQLPTLRAEHQPHLVIANAENIRNGSGISPSQFDWLRERGIDAVTLGDHAFREPKITDYLQDPARPIARPANFSARAPGKTSIRLDLPGFPPVMVLTLLGRIYFPQPADDPFAAVDRWIDSIGDPSAILIVEAHMEATSEKVALARYVDGRVSAVVGTHTHIPTADARLLPNGTAYITDLGMCGPYDSVLGREVAPILKHMTTGLRTPFAVAEGDERLCGALIRLNPRTRRALSIERLEYRADQRRPPFTHG